MRKATLAANMTPLLAAWKAGHMALVSAIAATAQRRAPSRLSHLKIKITCLFNTTGDFMKTLHYHLVSFNERT
jgi:hypothetical protein